MAKTRGRRNCRARFTPGAAASIYIPKEQPTMHNDEKLMFGKMIEIVNGQDAGLSSNAAMNLVAALIVGMSQSLAEAEAAAEYAGQQISLMVKAHWNVRDTGHHGHEGHG